MNLKLLVLLFCPVIIHAQTGSFAPQAGTTGSDAVHKDDTLFRDWAVSCEVQRGLRQINEPDSGYASSGNQNYAVGKADAPLVVSLGDGGVATLTFTSSIYDGEGPDFAVFENGFGSGEDCFLELAYVEVSSDGQTYVRFPSVSEVLAQSQTGTFGNTDASQLKNLAGKYTVHQGVPFDLAELPDTSVLDKSKVTHVRVIDVVGSIDTSYASFDQYSHIINDPWPTNFAQSGFDLDAVGVIHSNLPLAILAIPIQAGSQAPQGCYDLNGRYVPCNSSRFGLLIEVNEKGAHRRLNAPIK